MKTLVHCTVALTLILGLGSARSQTTDQAAFANLMHGTFDRPDAQLKIAPVVVAGNHAIAGWTQGEMGGRALLGRKQQAWELILCAGDGIRSRDALAKAGIPNQDAATLERELAEAESSAASKSLTKRVEQEARFEDLRQDRDAWRDQAQRLALPSPQSSRSWWRWLRSTG